MHKLFEIPPITLFLCAFCAFLWLKNPFNLRNPRLINDLRAFGIFTTVESALQISPFCTNKANFKQAKLNVTSIITEASENMSNWAIFENEPNQSQFKPN